MPLPNIPAGNISRRLEDRLVMEVGVSASEARDLVEVLGADWGSLIREARLLKRQQLRAR